jgi:GDP-D-mannose dehydratase
MKLVVTGSSGFVGRHFCSRYGGVPFEDQDGAVDLCDTRRVQSAVAALMPTAVLHLAAQSSVAASFHDPLGTLAVNFLGTLNLLQALSASCFQGVFVYVSSADVYGQTAEADLPTRDSTAVSPQPICSQQSCGRGTLLSVESEAELSCRIDFAYVGLNSEDYVVIDPRFYRPAEVDSLVGNPAKANARLGWTATTPLKSLMQMMVDADLCHVKREQVLHQA